MELTEDHRGNLSDPFQGVFQYPRTSFVCFVKKLGIHLQCDVRTARKYVLDWVRKINATVKKTKMALTTVVWSSAFQQSPGQCTAYWLPREDHRQPLRSCIKLFLPRGGNRRSSQGIRFASLRACGKTYTAIPRYEE